MIKMINYIKKFENYMKESFPKKISKYSNFFYNNRTIIRNIGIATIIGLGISSVPYLLDRNTIYEGNIDNISVKYIEGAKERSDRENKRKNVMELKKSGVTLTFEDILDEKKLDTQSLVLDPKSIDNIKLERITIKKEKNKSTLTNEDLRNDTISGEYAKNIFKISENEYKNFLRKIRDSKIQDRNSELENNLKSLEDVFD